MIRLANVFRNLIGGQMTKRPSLAFVVVFFSLATAGTAVAANLPAVQSRKPSVWPFNVVSTDDWNRSPDVMWRIPDINLTPADMAASSAIEDLLAKYAQAVDSQNPTAVGDLFAPTGTFNLYYVNGMVRHPVQFGRGGAGDRGARPPLPPLDTAPPPGHRDGTPLYWSPTGRGPSGEPDGGVAGEGCTAKGPTAIANYMRGAGLSGNFKLPAPKTSNTSLIDLRVKLDKANAMRATSHAYVNSDAQLFAEFVRLPNVGWKFSRLDIVYNDAKPTAPCLN